MDEFNVTTPDEIVEEESSSTKYDEIFELLTEEVAEEPTCGTCEINGSCSIQITTNQAIRKHNFKKGIDGTPKAIKEVNDSWMCGFHTSLRDDV